MTRRATAGLARLFPLLLITGALAVVLAAAGVAACGGSGGGDSPQPTATVTVTEIPADTPSATPSASVTPVAASTPVSLYFVRDGALCAVARSLPSTAAPARATLKALFKGPTASEAAAGVSTTLAGGIELKAISIAGGEARVDLSARFLASEDDPELRPTAQVVYALTQYSTVRAVSITVDGQPFPAAESAESPPRVWRRADFTSLEPAIFVEHPGLGAEVSSPFTLSGAASVYEGSFTARLVDDGGRRIVSATVQATRGAPGRGRFRKEIAFSTSSAAGTLIVFTQSMEDGSQQNTLRIPVTFSGQ